MEKTFVFDVEEYEEKLAELDVFGWKLASKKKRGENMTVVVQRDETTDLNKQLAVFEEEYRRLEAECDEKRMDINRLDNPGKKPEWSYWTKDRGFGSYFVYYGDYEPVTFWNIVFLVPPFILFGLPLLIVKLKKNKKSKAKYEEELAAYNEKLDAYNAEKQDMELVISAKETEMDDIYKEARHSHSERVANNAENITSVSSIVFCDIITNIERIGDHCTNIIEDCEF